MASFLHFGLAKFLLIQGLLGLYQRSNAFQSHSRASSVPFRRPCKTRIANTALKVINFEEHDTDLVLQLPIMQAELDTIYSEIDNVEDEETIGLSTRIRQEELKEKISNAKMSAEFGIRRAQLEFYEAFSSQDVEKMERVWSDGDNVRCVHPGLPAITGKGPIMNSWKQLFNGKSFPIGATRVQIEICGKMAFVSCIEKNPEGKGAELEVLNAYRREDGEWRMTLHMASPIIVSMDM